MAKDSVTKKKLIRRCGEIIRNQRLIPRQNGEPNPGPVDQQAKILPSTRVPNNTEIMFINCIPNNKHPQF